MPYVANWPAQTLALRRASRYHNDMTLTLFGIPNCDTVKKARRWLDAQGVTHQFHDLRKDGLTDTRLQQWIDALGWEKLLNRNGTTFRKLPETQKEDLDAAHAKALMLDQVAMIRRPVVVSGETISVGFKEAEWQDRFGA